jgi:TfoX/Sxy family transcriptional regulator of competence genes
VFDELLREPDVDEGTGFGSNPGLRVGGKIFAMEVDGRLVVKLPAERVAALTEAGGAEPFVIGKRTMREWVAVEPGAHDWPALAREALAFVRA